MTFTPSPARTTSHVDQVAFTPCTGPASAALALPGGGLRHHQGGELRHRRRARQPQPPTSEREAAGVPLCPLCPQPGRATPVAAPIARAARKSAGTTRSSRSEASPDDGGGGISHNRGTTDQQAGTFMHEFGHTPGARARGPGRHQLQAQLSQRHELHPPVRREPHPEPPAGLLASRGPDLPT